MNLTFKAILQGASLLLQERAIETRLQAIRARRRATAKHFGSSGIGRATDRTDLTICISLADYLALFGEKEPKDIQPTVHTYESDNYETVNGNPTVTARGVKHYLSYPPQFAGTLPTKPPTHVWVESSTDHVWAPGDPKPVAVSEAKAA